jgi:hypothetical protein
MVNIASEEMILVAGISGLEVGGTVATWVNGLNKLALDSNIRRGWLRITVSLEAEGVTGKNTQKILLDTAVLKSDIKHYAYPEFGAFYDFQVGKYAWRNAEIYLTPKEALSLYRIVSGHKFGNRHSKSDLNAMYRMRQRFGKEFPGKIS